jgi:hypothetical protein
MPFLIIVFSSIFITFAVFMLLNIFNKYLPRWFCDHMEMHLEPRYKLDGGNRGHCPRCWKEVFRTREGNWM